MTKKKIRIEFDPDMLYLTREQVIEVIDAIITGWKANGKANFLYIAALNAFKAAVYIMPIKELNDFWRRFSRAFEMINEASQLGRMKAEYNGVDDRKVFEMAFEKALDRIRSGELFG